MIQIASRRFKLTDQQKFAALSGDFNPIHIDPIAARRFMFGQAVVHGVHTLLWLMDQWLTGHPEVRITSLRADFRNPVRLHEDVFFSVKVIGEGQVRLEAGSTTAQLVSAKVRWGPVGEPPDVRDHSPPVEPADDLRGDQILSAAGTVPLEFPRKLATEMLPSASAKLPADQFAALLACTRVVGMRVPGFHSLLSSVDLADSRETSPVMAYAVDEFDERFSRAVIHLTGGGLSGTAVAFRRPAPATQANYHDASRSVIAGEFADERAIVIGGSRGLGEIAVKQLAAGGASVRFSYHQGEADARRIESEIGSAGGKASCFQLDVNGELSAFEDLCKSYSPTALYFFSTSSILGAPRGKFSAALFHDLSRIYVDGFLNVLMVALAGGTLKSVMQPSSVAIEETPIGMTEYAAAKAAAETLMRGLQKSYSKVHFHAPRWGRMPTDLTASIAAAEITDPLPVVLAALREMKRG